MISREIKATLPYPNGISVNSCWKLGKNRLHLNPKVNKFRKDVYYLLYKEIGFGDEVVEVSIKMYPPDKRIRDIDNILKVTLDALQYAGIYDNDSQIQKLYIEKCAPIKGGMLEISIKSMD